MARVQDHRDEDVERVERVPEASNAAGESRRAIASNRVHVHAFRAMRRGATVTDRTDPPS
jgi:hypothetical protein